MTMGLSLIGDMGGGSPYALISHGARSIGTIIPDVVVEELHHDLMMITQHPVETGATISDHAFKMPSTVQITGGFSNSTAQAVGYVQFVYQEFLALQASRVPFDVATGKRQYTNMLIADIGVTTDSKSEFALNFIAVLQEVILTGSALTQPASTQAMPQQTASVSNSGAASTPAGSAQPSSAIVMPVISQADIAQLNAAPTAPAQ